MTFAILAIAALAVVLTLPLTRRPLLNTLNVFPAMMLLIVGAISLALWRPIRWRLLRLPFISRFTDILQFLVERLGKRKVGLAAGQREAVAREVWPEARFPFLYRDVPDDIRRPLWEDRELVSGKHSAWLADRAFSDGMTKAGAELGAIAAGIALIIMPIASALMFVLTRRTQASNATVVLEAFPGETPVTVSDWTVWQTAFPDMTATFGQGLASLLGLIFAWLLIALGIGIAVALATVENWRQEAAARYKHLFKATLARSSHRADAMTHTSYVHQVAHATGDLNDTPLFKVGKSSGTMRLRGDPAAPTQGQVLALDHKSLFEHLMVFGGSREDTTAAILMPVLSQVLAQKKFGAYVADARGVLWQPADQIAAACGRASDVIRIGAASGDMGVNIAAQLTPTQTAAALRSALMQMGGVAGDSRWPDMAANLMRHMLTIGRAYAATPEGRAEAQTLHPDSLWWAYQAVLDENRLATALEAVGRQVRNRVQAVDAARTKGNREAVLLLEERTRVAAGAEVMASHAYLMSGRAGMASDTRNAIIAHLSQLMDGFAAMPVLRERFISGLDQNTTTLDGPLGGKIALITLNPIEDGHASRLVAILLKAILYREARLRQAEFKKLGRNAQDGPCIVMLDDVHEIAAADPTTSLSDAVFWSGAASLGLAGVFATPSISALAQAMGEDAARTFMQQARSKVFLQSEDRATISYACWLAGEYEGNCADDDRRLDGDEQMIADSSPSVRVGDNELLQDSEIPRLYFVAALSFLKRAGIAIGNEPRHERKRDSAMAPALTPADFMAMGRWHAYARMQRAGLARHDIMELTQSH